MSLLVVQNVLFMGPKLLLVVTCVKCRMNKIHVVTSDFFQNLKWRRSHIKLILMVNTVLNLNTQMPLTVLPQRFKDDWWLTGR